ncbi:MAG: nickel pincer cofactor biosynthesis protein LarB [Phycisphaerae bacterium]|nr:nickel pincer cofactor biosynthesis protein LarB [Phycisphaerae bacterium]
MLRNLLDQIASGVVSVEDAVERLRTLPFEDLGFARVDHHRGLRCGFPEVIFGQGKTMQQVEEIFQTLVHAGHDVLATRVSRSAARRVLTRFPQADYNRLARTLALRQSQPTSSSGFIGIICAGTADLPVAEEARITAEMMGQRTRTFYDVGVAGLHRLLAESEAIRQANVLIVVAGMEGALPSVVGGLVDHPIIAVPTSVGYGAGFQGLAPLLAMLNSCASGLSVVNIDNGFGAAYQATLINRLAEGKRPSSNHDVADE